MNCYDQTVMDALCRHCGRRYDLHRCIDNKCPGKGDWPRGTQPGINELQESYWAEQSTHFEAAFAAADLTAPPVSMSQ